MSILYWLTVLGNISAFAAVACGIFTILCVLSSFSRFDDDWPKSIEKLLK